MARGSAFVRFSLICHCKSTNRSILAQVHFAKSAGRAPNPVQPKLSLKETVLPKGLRFPTGPVSCVGPSMWQTVICSGKKTGLIARIASQVAPGHCTLNVIGLSGKNFSGSADILKKIMKGI
jgi:hypothetical protein